MSMEKPDLEPMVREWQERLRLLDWDIVSKYERMDEMPDGKQGTMGWTLMKKQAVMRVLDPIDYPRYCKDFPQDIEATVVHELLHLHLEPAAPDKKDDAAFGLFECAVDQVARALVGMKRASSL